MHLSQRKWHIQKLNSNLLISFLYTTVRIFHYFHEHSVFFLINLPRSHFGGLYVLKLPFSSLKSSLENFFLIDYVVERFNFIVFFLSFLFEFLLSAVQAWCNMIGFMQLMWSWCLFPQCWDACQFEHSLGHPWSFWKKSSFERVKWGKQLGVALDNIFSCLSYDCLMNIFCSYGGASGVIDWSTAC